MNMKARSALLIGTAGLFVSGCGGDADAAPDQQVETSPSAAVKDAGPAPVMVTHLEVEPFAALINRPDIRLIDVRTAEEVAQGMIPDAENIPLDQFDPAKLDLSDGRKVVLYCRSGRRSQIAAIRLGEHVGKPVPHLAGGILAWQAAGKPVTQP